MKTKLMYLAAFMLFMIGNIDAQISAPVLDQDTQIETPAVEKDQKRAKRDKKKKGQRLKAVEASLRSIAEADGKVTPEEEEAIELEIEKLKANRPKKGKKRKDKKKPEEGDSMEKQ